MARDGSGTALLRGLMRLARFLPGGRPYFRRFLPAGIVTVEGLRMRLYPHDNYTDYRLWMRRRSPERRSLETLKGLVSGVRCLILDVGANCGSYALPLAVSAGPGSEVLAFEPNPVMARRLRENIALNGLEAAITVHECALGARDGTAVLMINPRNLGGASLRRDKGEGAERVEVPVRTLAGFAADAGRYERFVVKLDAEGFEDQVLTPYLAQAEPAPRPDLILLEVAHRGDWETDVTRDLEQLGYACLFAGDGNMLFAAPDERAFVGQGSLSPAQTRAPAVEGVDRG